VAAAGDGARMVGAAEDGVRFDETPLLVATDGMAESFGIDHRRMRPNILLGGVDGMSERGWEGRRLRIGEAVIGLERGARRAGRAQLQRRAGWPDRGRRSRRIALNPVPRKGVVGGVPLYR
jgi:hypothetical protein